VGVGGRPGVYPLSKLLEKIKRERERKNKYTKYRPMYKELKLL
jgi:hypothetical protein